MLLYGLAGEASGLGTDPSTCDPSSQYYDPGSDSCLPFDAAAAACDPSTQYWDPGSGQCLPFSSVTGGGYPTPGKGAPSQGSGTPWWATLTQALSAGITSGITKPGAPAVAPPKPAWYTTPAGMGGIAVGLILLVVLLRK